jgi:hypothetical protein
VRNLSAEQLSRVESLYSADLDPELLEDIERNYPHLLVAKDASTTSPKYMDQKAIDKQL